MLTSIAEPAGDITGANAIPAETHPASINEAQSNGHTVAMTGPALAILENPRFNKNATNNFLNILTPVNNTTQAVFKIPKVLSQVNRTTVFLIIYNLLL